MCYLKRKPKKYFDEYFKNFLYFVRYGKRNNKNEFTIYNLQFTIYNLQFLFYN